MGGQPDAEAVTDDDAVRPREGVTEWSAVAVRVQDRIGDSVAEVRTIEKEMLSVAALVPVGEAMPSSDGLWEVEADGEGEAEADAVAEAEALTVPEREIEPEAEAV